MNFSTTSSKQANKTALLLPACPKAYHFQENGDATSDAHVSFITRGFTLAAICLGECYPGIPGKFLEGYSFGNLVVSLYLATCKDTGD